MQRIQLLGDVIMCLLARGASISRVKADFKENEKPFFDKPGNTRATTHRHVP